jgi:ParB family transcriptional regulator, chromosome partitioning protein
MTDNTRVREISLAHIERNPNQPRKTFPPDYIAQLAASIKKRGLIQPINVRPIPGRTGYMIVAGECRWRAHQLLGVKTIKAIVESMDDAEMQLRAIVENLQRRDMNPIEEGRAFQTLLDTGYTIPQIVAELGLSGAQIVQNRLDLLELGDDIQKLVATAQLSTSMGWAIRLAPRSQQARIVRDIAAGRLRTVEQVRHACIALRDAAAQVDAFASAPKASTADVAAVSRLEHKIESITSMVLAGFKEGECVAAQRVSPDRVKTLADKLALIRKHVLQMEHDLRRIATQREIVLGSAA